MWYSKSISVYTSFIHQIAFDTLQKYHEMLMKLVSCHGAVQNGRIPKMKATFAPNQKIFVIRKIKMTYKRMNIFCIRFLCPSFEDTILYIGMVLSVRPVGPSVLR